jgi:hypothetical protein
MRKFYTYLSSGCLIAFLILFNAGCATQKLIPFASVSCPSNKALVYVYWGHFWMKRDGLVIRINKEPRVILHSESFYPLILEPGSVTLGYSARISMYPIFLTKDDMQLTIEAGKTYYVAYKAGKLIQVDAPTAESEIKNYTLAREWKE